MDNNLTCRDPACRDHAYCCASKFIKWGLGFFIFGFIVGFGVLIHYLMGADWNNSNEFITHMTLWFGSPLSLSSGYLQIGGLGMAAVGAAKLAMHRYWEDRCVPGTNATTSATYDTKTSAYDTKHLGKHHHGSGLGFALSIIGLILLFLTGYVGYFIIDAIWPGFYYLPIAAGKNWWLVLQGLSLLIYILGILSAVCCLCKCKRCYHK